MMLTTILKAAFDRFGRRYDYDASYLAGVAELDPAGGVKLGLVSFFTSHTFGAPRDAYYAAKITAVRHADCGSCLRLAVAMALEAGVERGNVVALLAGPADAVPEPMRFASRYAEAIIGNHPEHMELVEECRARWGEEGLAGLAAATVSGMFYPLLKRGLGHGNACEPVLAALKAQSEGVAADG
ncbi:MAG: hypothetical protein ACT6RL_07960 [Neoaquamicrobium sediminum]|uniref:hypothetical protein n=1 Tax=Neoaquamicrobium sediminum TaxID=1849104 RepID=UPI00403505C1